MRKFLLIFIISISAFASILDFKYINAAKEAYQNGDYKKAIENYLKVEDKNDKILFNLADSYYKAKEYEKAFRLYREIKDKNLEFKKLHNMGNTLAHLGKIDEAIRAYEKALKIKEDKDTRFNLELLKKMKKNQKKKQNNKNNKQKQNKNNQKNNNKQNKNSNQNNKNKKDQNKSNKENSKENKNNKQKNQNKGKKNKQLKPKPNLKPAPISDMEVRKYEKMLNKRGVNTLLLPLNTKGERKYENNINPW